MAGKTDLHKPQGMLCHSHRGKHASHRACCVIGASTLATGHAVS